MKIRNDYTYMKEALKLAKRGMGKTYPNPMVGAVIVRGGKVIGRGYHHKAGEPHAEVEAIRSVQGAIKGGTMFVTLEPCDHYGKTPPCTNAIIESGIKRINIAIKDPNSINNGRGIKRLKSSGIRVTVGLCAEEAKKLNRKYIKFITTGLPYITIKLAESLDGKIAARDGTSRWISSDASRKYVKGIRPSFDAIVVGSGTALKDDPYLLDAERKGYGVYRVIVDTCLKTPLDSNILKTATRAPVIIGTTELAHGSRIKKVSKIKNVEVIIVKSENNRLPLKKFFKKLAQKGIVNCLVEGGGELAGSLFDESLVDEVMFFIAPKIIGGDFSSVKGAGARTIKEAFELFDVEIKRFGSDIFFRGIVKK